MFNWIGAADRPHQADILASQPDHQQSCTGHRYQVLYGTDHQQGCTEHHHQVLLTVLYSTGHKQVLVHRKNCTRQPNPVRTVHTSICQLLHALPSTVVCTHYQMYWYCILYQCEPSTKLLSVVEAERISNRISQRSLC